MTGNVKRDVFDARGVLGTRQREGIPAFLGGRKDLMMANLVDLCTRETFDWSLASAIGVIPPRSPLGLPALKLAK
jgi:hypothetical protein